MPKKIAVVTGSRADYGLLRPSLRLLSKDEFFDLHIFVTGSHLSSDFGLTLEEIEQDNFGSLIKIDTVLASTTPVSTCKSVGLGVIGFAQAWEEYQPDCILVLGDRFEIFAAVQAAFIMNIPIAHLHGGEVTTAAFDDGLRHSITKMANLHLVAAQEYRHRVIQLGEDPATVFVVGAPGLECLEETDWVNKSELESALNINLSNSFALVTYHPETLDTHTPASQQNEIIEALNCFPSLQVIFTGANADPGGSELNNTLARWIAANKNRANAFSSLGQHRYFNLMKLASAVVGNSSSGIIEAPWLGVPTVNIGDRQNGRLRAPSVIDSPCEKSAIVHAITKALEAGRVLPDRTTLPYVGGAVSQNVVDLLKSFNFSRSKCFYDLPSPIEL